MAASRSDFLTQYKTISSKLKKRFLRKPNIAEASEQFSSLAKQQQQQECPQYAGFSCLALARCEQSIGNSSGESQALLDAARLFIEAELQNRDLQCPSFDEYLTAAINCYNQSIRVHIDQKQAGLAAALCLEVGNALRKLSRYGEAIHYFQLRAELLVQSPLEHLDALDMTSHCYISTSDYDSALVTLTEISSIIHKMASGTTKLIGVYSDLLAKCEISRVLLLLLLQPTPQRLQPENADLLEKYTWDTDTPVSYLSQDLLLLMQSVVVSLEFIIIKPIE